MRKENTGAPLPLRTDGEQALAEVRIVLLEQKPIQTNLLGSGKVLICSCFFSMNTC